MSDLTSNSSLPGRGDLQFEGTRSTYNMTPSGFWSQYLDTFSSTTSPRGCICKIADTDGADTPGYTLSRECTDDKSGQKGGT